MEQRLYSYHDMAKIACDGCKGCSECCQGMGDTVILNPLDVYQLCNNLNIDFDTLLQQYADLYVYDGQIMPAIRMEGEEERCVFLNKEGRCEVHPFRPGLCRLFPLGRNYEDGDYSYFIVDNACPKPNKTKVKISKWLNVEEAENYHDFIVDWHYFCKEFGAKMQKLDENEMKQINMFVLQTIYRKPYEPQKSFYAQYFERIRQIREIVQF